MASGSNQKFLKNLGKRIRDLRKAQNISQAQLGFESGLHRDQIGRIELGKQNTGIAHLYNISKALNVTIVELLNFQ